VIARDLPGVGFAEVLGERGYKYSFDALARTNLAFTDALGLKRYALYVFDGDFARGASSCFEGVHRRRGHAN
jgi:hypothetical protein